jgi:hypothetical protein
LIISYHLNNAGEHSPRGNHVMEKARLPSDL